ncbi:MAG: serine--tRNA ligase [Candidatus Cloacimonetes bacterium 4572_55]|nr:MAG: serine--tRNA ligase [Candidatus Cloacimonetes bacterium 4572_55]
MLDHKFVRKNIELVKKAVADKKESVNLDNFLKLEQERRLLLAQADALKHERNVVSKEISRLKRSKQDASDKISEMKRTGEKIKELDMDRRRVDEEIDEILRWTPNIPHESVPVGKDESDNVVIREWGDKPNFDFQPKPHWEIGERLGIMDFSAASKIAGSGFILTKGAGARLERALINFFLDTHTADHGYTEIYPPCLANEQSMFGTGQLPKLKDDMYCLEGDKLFLIPTGETPITNIHRDEILSVDRLPIFYTALTPCFRRESGASGKDTRGMARVHQFNKVEMVKFVRPENSWDELERLVANAEILLKKLGLPYRVVKLCTGDLSFAGAICFDLEIWSSGVKRYLEVSSCSNFVDFQARRANIRFRPNPKAKPQFVHTLNGSGLALPRTVIGIIENYQLEDGRVAVPEPLQPYMGGLKIIE